MMKLVGDKGHQLPKLSQAPIFRTKTQKTKKKPIK